LGARPQFIKLAPIAKYLEKNHSHKIIHTGQHYDHNMNDVFFQNLHIMKPDYNLNIGSGTHGYQTSKMIEHIERILISEKPDMVLIYGDTNSTLAGAIATTKLEITMAHIEAGLRSFDKSMPEEINRVLSDHVSDILFCPTNTAISNLNNENIKDGVYLVGDVMVDVLKQNIDISIKISNILRDLDLVNTDYFLATIHRQSNTDNYENLSNIVKALEKLENVVLPCHPRTKKMLINYGLFEKLNDNIKIIDPVGYFDMLVLQKNSKKILTDSGGIQKEAFILGVPCVTLRENTEWVETLHGGWNILVGPNKQKIIDATMNLYPEDHRENIFGNGDASKKISAIIDDFQL